MSATQALSYLREHGVDVELDGPDLLLVGAEALSEKTIARLRELKGEIVAELSRRSNEQYRDAEDGSGSVRAAFADFERRLADLPRRNGEALHQGGEVRCEKCGDLTSKGWPAHVGRHRWRWLCPSCAPTAGRA